MPIKQMAPFSGEEQRKKRNRFSVHFAKRGYRSYEGHSLSFSPDILVPNILTNYPHFRLVVFALYLKKLKQKFIFFFHGVT